MSSSSFVSTITSTSESVMNSVDTHVSRGLHFLGNKYLHNLLLVILILYAVYFAPRMNLPFAKVLDNYAVKFICVFLLAYLLSKSVRVGLLVAVVIVVGALLSKKLNNSDKQEHFSVSAASEMVMDAGSNVVSYGENKIKVGSEMVMDVGSNVVSYGENKIKAGSEMVMDVGSNVVSYGETKSEELLTRGGNALSTIGSGMLNKAESLLESEPRAISSEELHEKAAADHTGTLGKDLNTDEIKKIQKVVQEQAMAQVAAASEASSQQENVPEPAGVCMGRAAAQMNNVYGWNVNLDDGTYDTVKGYTSMYEEREYAPV